MRCNIQPLASTRRQKKAFIKKAMNFLVKAFHRSHAAARCLRTDGTLDMKSENHGLVYLCSFIYVLTLKFSIKN